MRIVVFGAGGRTGHHLVAQARARGHEVRAFVRDAAAFVAPGEGVEVIEGDARDAVAVERALADADAIVSVLALASADDEPAYSESTRTIVEAAERLGVRRIVVTANNDVLTDREVTGEYAAHAREHRRNRATIQGSELAWTIIAAPWVTDDEPRGTYDATIDAKAPGRRIGTADLATAVLDALKDDGWIGHVVGVSAA